MDVQTEVGARFHGELVALYFAPEIARRQKAGLLPADFQLRAAQLICYLDERPNQIRLNEEVRVLALVKLKPGANKAPGETVMMDELEEYEDLVLTEHDDPDCGHATMLAFRGRWLLCFDFRYNRAKGEVLASRARQFVELARGALGGPDQAPLVYNLFMAAELAAKALMIGVPGARIENARRHGAVHARLNEWAQLGNVPQAHAQCFNRLAELRSAVYRAVPFELSNEHAAEMLRHVDGLVARASDEVSLIHVPPRSCRTARSDDEVAT